jgi:tripartite-type tricarboxylate transporter receptor subunit TctC
MQKIAVALAVIAATMIGAGTDARAAEDFYKGKQITLVVPTPPGGIYDIFARLMAEHMPRHIPGNPIIIPQNIGAASGLVGANQMANIAPKDGTWIASAHSSLPTAPLLVPGAQFKMDTLQWLGSITKDPFVAYVWHTSAVQNFDDLKTKGGTFGGQAVGSASIDFAIFAREYFGLKLKIVTGYPNSPTVKLAMQRGEVDGTFGNGFSDLRSSEPTWIPQKQVRILTQFGFTKHPEMPDVPLFFDLAKTEADKQALRLLFGRQEFSKAYYTTPGVPPERLALLRKAFDDTIKDPAFLAATKKANVPVEEPMNGQDLTALIKQIGETPQPVVDRLVNLFKNFQDTK